jgi:hypothetical protein
MIVPFALRFVLKYEKIDCCNYYAHHYPGATVRHFTLNRPAVTA